jgi:hypothetical protein
MPQINKSQFAKLAGVSRNAIGKAVTAGAVICINGKIDIDHPTNKAYLQIDRNPKKKETSKIIKTPEKPYPGKKGKVADKPEKEKAKKNGTKIRNTISLPPGHMSKTDADIARLQVVTAKEKVNLAQKMETLILRESVGKLFGGMHSVVLNYFFPLGDRLTPIIGGICGVSDPKDLLKIKTVIDKEVMRGLSEFKREAEKGI